MMAGQCIGPPGPTQPLHLVLGANYVDDEVLHVLFLFPTTKIFSSLQSSRNSGRETNMHRKANISIICTYISIIYTIRVNMELLT